MKVARMDFKKVAVLASLVLICTLAIVPMSDSDAETQVGDIRWDLDTMRGGSLWIDLKGTSSDFDAEVTITENGNQIYKETHKVTRGDCTLEIYLPNMKSAGDHPIVIYLESDNSGASFDHSEIHKTIHVDNNILSNWTTYLAIAIAVIVIAVIIYLRLRDKPKVENTMTFEQLEEERKAEMAAKSENRGKKKKASAQAPAASTEKKRYSGKKKE